MLPSRLLARPFSPRLPPCFISPRGARGSRTSLRGERAPASPVRFNRGLSIYARDAEDISASERALVKALMMTRRSLSSGISRQGRNGYARSVSKGVTRARMSRGRSKRLFREGKTSSALTRPSPASRSSIERAIDRVTAATRGSAISFVGSRGRGTRVRFYAEKSLPFV